MGNCKNTKIMKNAKLAVRGTARAAGYDLATVKVVILPEHGKVLISTDLSMAIPSAMVDMPLGLV